MGQFLVLFLLFCCLSYLPLIVSFPLTLLQKAALIVPTSYNLLFIIKANVPSLAFNYTLNNELHFDLQSKVDQLVLQTTVRYVEVMNVTFGHAHNEFLGVNFTRINDSLVLRMKNGSLFAPGHYMVEAIIRSDIPGERGRGIQYSLHMDRQTKSLDYSIWMNFLPSYAKNVVLCAYNTTAMVKIEMIIVHKFGYHAFFVRQSLAVQYLDRSKLKSSHRDEIVSYKMYPIIMPLAFLAAYLTPNVRLTQGSTQYSATVTVGRNQIGRFSDEYRYINEIFYRYVKEYRTFGPLQLPLRYEDVFLHLTQNKTSNIEVDHSSCFLSMPYALQYPKNVASLNAYMARCLAANHIMTRRYPVHFSAYYILVGLQEYYAKMMRLEGGGVPAPNHFSGIGKATIVSFCQDDYEMGRPILGATYKKAEEYNYMRVERALCFMNMLKHLIITEKGLTFDHIVSDFLSEDLILYNVESFMRAYQNRTNNKVFLKSQAIKTFFNSWTRQEGYPIVSIKKLGHTLEISQSNLPWYKKTKGFAIPISIVLESRATSDINRTHPDVWLWPHNEKGSYDLRGGSKWYLANNQRTGYYRVLYDAWNYKLLRLELLRGDMNKIHPVTRGQILDDVLFFAKLRVVSYDIAMELVECLKHETSEVVWQMAEQELEFLNRYLRFTPVYPAFKHFIKIMSRKFYRRTVEKAGDYAPASRSALKWACFAELQHCLKYTHKMFLSFLRDRTTFEYLDKIICEGVRLVDADTFTYIKLALFNQYRGLEHELYLTAMICLDNYEFLTESLNVLFRKTSVVAGWIAPAEKTRQMLRMCKNSEMGARAVLDFIFRQPTLVKINIGEMNVMRVLDTLSKFLYKRSHERKLRFIAMYLNLKRSKSFLRNILRKREWLDLNLLIVSKILDNFQDVSVVEEYADI